MSAEDEDVPLLRENSRVRATNLGTNARPTGTTHLSRALPEPVIAQASSLTELV